LIRSSAATISVMFCSVLNQRTGSWASGSASGFYRLPDMDQCAVGTLQAVLDVGPLPQPAGFEGLCAEQGAVLRMHELQPGRASSGAAGRLPLRPAAAAFPTSSRMRRQDR